MAVLLTGELRSIDSHLQSLPSALPQRIGCVAASLGDRHGYRAAACVSAGNTGALHAMAQYGLSGC